MKKTLKKWLTVIASTVILASPLSNSVTAQTVYDEAFFTELTQANQSYESAKFEGILSVSTGPQGETTELGQVNFSGAFNGSPLVISFNGELISSLLGGQPLFAQAFLENNVAYYGVPGMQPNETQWQAIDLSSEIQQVKDAYEEELNQYAANPELSAMINQKYTDVTETDADYIVTLKQNINAEELWADVQQLVDLEAIKEQAITQLEAQTGESITDEQRAQLEQAYSASSLEQFLKLNPIVESVYDKETKKLKQLRMEVNVVTTDFVEKESSTDEVGFLPENILVKMELNLTEHDVVQEISVPAEALSTEVKTLKQLEQGALEAAETMEQSETDTQE